MTTTPTDENTFSTKRPNERFPISFDFGNVLRGEKVVTIDWVCTLYSGSDPSPSSVLDPRMSTTGAVYSRHVRNGVDGTTYKIVLTLTTVSGNIYSAVGFLPVVA